MPPPSLDRRTFLRLGAAGALATAGVGALAACGSGSGDDGGSGGRGRAPGGALRVAALGNPGDTLDLRTAGGIADFLVAYNLWDSLALLQGGDVVLALAEEATPDATGATWTIRVRDGVTFHDGRPLTAEDVAYSLRYFGDPDASPTFASYYADVDLAGLRRRDARTLEVPLRRPRGDFLESVLAALSIVVPDGAIDPQAGNGTGPFRLLDYRPGEGARLEAYADHWRGRPALDGIEVRPIADAGARLDAVRSGEVDYASGITPAGAATVAGDGGVAVRRGGPANANAYLFAANVGLAPYDDPRVVEGLRLAIDRQALVDTVLLGEGTVGHDLVGLGLPGYPEGLPARERDPERARALFADAGVDRLTVRAADITAGVVDSAGLLAEHLAEAGVELRVDEAAADTYFSDYATVLSTPLQGLYFVNRPPGTHLALNVGPAASFNVTGYASSRFGDLLAECQATVDDEARHRRLGELAALLHEEGGEVVWGFGEQLDASVPGLEGVELTQSVPLFAAATLA